MKIIENEIRDANRTVQITLELDFDEIYELANCEDLKDFYLCFGEFNQNIDELFECIDWNDGEDE